MGSCTTPVIAEKSGIASYVDLMMGFNSNNR